MVRLRPSKKVSYSDNSPQFFKIFIPHQCSKRLRIPPAFVKHFEGVLPSKSILRSPARRSWQVDVSEVDGDVYFQNGWEEFVKNNFLEFGDFLVFSYNGESKFYVSLYGRNSCQKEVAVDTEKSKKQLTCFDVNQINELCNSKELICPDGKEEMAPLAIQSSNLSFEITMYECYVNKRFINIPLRFCKAVKKFRRAAKLQHSTKTWLVKLVGCSAQKMKISKGWNSFVEENNLQVGDVCTFELITIESDSYVMNVSIHKKPTIVCI